MGLHEQLSTVECVEVGASGAMKSLGNPGLGLQPAHSSAPRLDVNFNTDPLFVRAGQNGVTVPIGLSAVESDTSVPVLKFKSDDAYATAAELSRRASAAKEMRAALAAQIYAKRMVTSKAFNADDHYEAQLEASRTLDFQDAAYSSPRPHAGGLSHCRSDGRLASYRGSPTPTACSLTAREVREPFPSPSPRGSASESFQSRAPAIPARRAAAARELQGALDAQMRAAALLQARMQTIPTTSSDADGTSSSSIAGDREPSPLTTWEDTGGHGRTWEDTGGVNSSPAGSHAHSSEQSSAGWQAHLLAPRPRRSLQDTAGTSIGCSVSLADGVGSSGGGVGGGSGDASRGGGDDSRGAAPQVPPQVPPLPTSHGTTESHISFGEGRSMHSGRSSSYSHPEDLQPSAARRPGRASTGISLARPAVPMLRFRSDDAYATEAELAARAAASARLRADLDRQVAEKQLRREQERGDGGETGAASGRFRSPLSHRSSSGSGRITPGGRLDAGLPDAPRRRAAISSPRSAQSARTSGIGRSPSDGPRSSGLSHVTDGFRREGSARENDVPGMEDAAELLLKGLEQLKGSQTPRPPLQPSGNALPSPRPQVSARYTSMPTPLFDSADTTPLPTARDSVDGGGPLSARGEPLSARGVPRSARGEPLSARGRTLSSEISPRIPLPSPRQLSRYTRMRLHGGVADGVAAVGGGQGHPEREDPVERSWRLAREQAELARKRRVRQHAAVASPELLADLEASAETGASSDAVEQPPPQDSAAVGTLPRVDSTDETSLGTTCSSDSCGTGVPCGDLPTKTSAPRGWRTRPWSYFSCCLCGRA